MDSCLASFTAIHTSWSTEGPQKWHRVLLGPAAAPLFHLNSFTWDAPLDGPKSGEEEEEREREIYILYSATQHGAQHSLFTKDQRSAAAWGQGEAFEGSLGSLPLAGRV